MNKRKRQIVPKDDFEDGACILFIQDSENWKWKKNFKSRRTVRTIADVTAKDRQYHKDTMNRQTLLTTIPDGWEAIVDGITLSSATGDDGPAFQFDRIRELTPHSVFYWRDDICSIWMRTEDLFSGFAYHFQHRVETERDIENRTAVCVELIFGCEIINVLAELILSYFSPKQYDPLSSNVYALEQSVRLASSS